MTRQTSETGVSAAKQDEAFRPFVNRRFPHLLHGADYNPDQWMAVPGVLDEDIRLMRLAGCNVMSVGIFAWSRLEPREGVYDFAWLDATMDRLAEAGVAVMLATPSGARPLWMSLKYPEVNRCLREGRRVDPGKRHDHCPTSPVYREACVRVNTRLAERYGRHPALLAWHVSNEYGGGTLVATYGLGMVDEDDRAFAGGWPGGRLREVMGVWTEEHDGVYPGRAIPVHAVEGNALGVRGAFPARDVCAILHAREADVVATYGGEFYAGSPAVTVNRHGTGHAWYLGARMAPEFLDDFYAALLRQLQPRRALDIELPEGLSATCRTDGGTEYVFLMNFAGAMRRVSGPALAGFVDATDGTALADGVDLASYGCRVLRRSRIPARG